MTSTRNILVVEDDAYLVNFYSRLESELSGKVSIKVVDNASDGISELTKNTYDALILDLIMPEVNGYAVLAFLEESGKSDDIYTAVLTNLDTEEDRAKTSKLGADAYYVKSDLSNRLLQSILLGEEV